jgi:hypothetical protein
MLSILERLYWQRTDGYIPPYGSKENISEAMRFKANKQVFDSADAVCSSYWKSVFSGTEESTWIGFSVFDQYYEFRRWNELVFAPCFSRRYLGKNWTYFSHEVAHQAIDRLNEKEQFAELHQSLVRNLSRFSSLLKYSTPEYLALEVESGILATLISGEQYITALTDLEYYPSFIIFSRRNFLGRAIRCPVLMRVLICSLTARLAWGLGDHASFQSSTTFQEQILERAIENVKEEDLFARSIILLWLEKSSRDPRKILSTEQSTVSIRKSLVQVLNYLDTLEMVTIPNVIKMILEGRIIQRLKKFAKYDFYDTDSGSCYYDVNMAKVRKVKRPFDLANELFVKTPETVLIQNQVTKKIKFLEQISYDLEHKKSTMGKPRDIIACLSSLQEKTGFIEELSQVALASILGRKQ